MTFKMIIDLDVERMKSDGIDLEACCQELQGFLDKVPEMKEIEMGVFVTDDFGVRSYLMDFLEDCEWFMKYVSKWLWVDSNGETCDVIEENREMGIRCSYE